MKKQLFIDLKTPPKVLFLGNGVLRLGDGMAWDTLIAKLVPEGKQKPDLDKVPTAMQPEAVRGTDVEEIQSLTVKEMEEAEKAGLQNPHRILKALVFMDFDAIITTNYTYEIEKALCGGIWSESKRKRCHVTLDNNPSVHHNTGKCNLIKDIHGREIPVFHIHGEQARKRSMVLSYYSYANAVYFLKEMSKRRKDAYEEHRESGKPLPCQGWLDYFVMGDVYAVGFGFDLSEFDIWWAIERKDREHSRHGKLHAYMLSDSQRNEKTVMFRAMDVVEHGIELQDNNYEAAYEKIIKELAGLGSGH